MVINPKIYMEQLEELGLEDLEIEPSSRGEAVKLIREIEDHISNLNKIRYNLHGDMRIIRKEYLERLVEEGIRGDRKRRRLIMDERDRVLSPYEGIDRLIDGFIDWLENVPIFLREYAGNHNNGC